ncbi:MAG: DUF4173 domain-containing protein [Lachnospiraceae bacterium]|nr:DUF4173 domain-containing protein [Lachnospiraceae bacterium]
MALSINICMTDSPYLAFFDRLFIFVLFFTLFLTNLYDDETWDVSRYTSAIALTVCSLVKYLPRPFRDAIERAKSRRAAKTALTADDDGQSDPLMSAGISEENEPSPFRRNIKYVVLGLVIALPILLVVLPLLASSDAVFSDLLERMLTFDIDFDRIEDIVGIGVMLVCIFFVAYTLVCRLSEKSLYLDSPVPDRRTGSPVVAITISAVMLMVYGLYCGIQVIYLFMGYGTLPEGYTYAEYVHEGFYQLVFVCIINLILVLLCRKYSRENYALKVMLTLISLCTFIMIFSSAYRMMLYIGAYGLTFLRLYVLWALTVIFLAMTGTCVYIYKPDMPFYKYSLVILTATWAVFALARPDYHIARYNLTHENARDMSYIRYNLSADAAPAVARYAGDDEAVRDYLSHLAFKHDVRGTYEMTSYDDTIIVPKLTFRTWNYSIYMMGKVAEAQK